MNGWIYKSIPSKVKCMDKVHAVNFFEHDPNLDC